ncbi:MAG: DUF192 domain-containing protein [Ignavibacteria bacterium]|nr:DUF192 domain-containing protein [Ignavibacteria bacterium]
MDKKVTSKKTPKKNNSSFYRFVFIAVAIFVLMYILYLSFFDDTDKREYNLSTDKTEQFKNIKEPQFVKEGELEFLNKDGKTVISKIDIEIADNTPERMQGLMYRKSMDENRGMLFIFQNNEHRGFYMKNTLIPLDIIFLDSAKQVLKIFKNTTPFSERTLESGLPAKFVVEVNAGYTDRYGIKEGDMIKFSYQ